MHVRSHSPSSIEQASAIRASSADEVRQCSNWTIAVGHNDKGTFGEHSDCRKICDRSVRKPSIDGSGTRKSAGQGDQGIADRCCASGLCGGERSRGPPVSWSTASRRSSRPPNATPGARGRRHRRTRARGPAVDRGRKDRGPAAVALTAPERRHAASEFSGAPLDPAPAWRGWIQIEHVLSYIPPLHDAKKVC